MLSLAQQQSPFLVHDSPDFLHGGVGGATHAPLVHTAGGVQLPHESVPLQPSDGRRV
jgi:hypothetical protein